MAIVEAINIPIGVTGTETVQQAANSYEDLGDAVAKTQLEAERLAQQFGINDAKTQEAIKIAGKYKQQMEELDFAIDGARGGTDQIFRATQGVVAGFEIAVGAAALFGSENEQLQKTLMQVQGAMALSQGIKDFQEFLPAITSMATAIKTQLVTAFTTLRGAIMATGIGALVVAIAVAIDQIGKYNDAIDETIDKELELSKIRQKEAIESLEAETRAYQSSTEIRLLLAQKEGKSAQQVADLEIKLLKERRTQLREFYANENNDQAARAAALQEYNKVSDNVTKLEIQRDIDIVNSAKERNKELEDLNNKKFEDWLSNQLAQNEAEEANRQFLLDRDQKALEDEQEMINALADFNAKIVEDEEEMFNAQLEYEVELAEMKLANAEYVKKRKKEIDEEEKKSKQAVADLEKQIFDQSQALANAIINIVGQQSKVGKGIALAQIAADTAVALTGALKNSQSSTPDNVATGGLAGIAKYIGIATTILSNSKRAYDILKSPAPSTSLSGGGGSATVPRFNAPTTRLPQTDEFTQVRRVYVTESDISNVQNKVKVTESLSQF